MWKMNIRIKIPKKHANINKFYELITYGTFSKKI